MVGGRWSVVGGRWACLDLFLRRAHRHVGLLSLTAQARGLGCVLGFHTERSDLVAQPFVGMPIVVARVAATDRKVAVGGGSPILLQHKLAGDALVVRSVLNRVRDGGEED